MGIARFSIIFIFSLCCFYNLQAQDPHFSQYFASPLTLNPALTGKFDGLVRVAGNYRNQWPTISNAFRTGTISADFQLLPGKLPVYDQLGVGIMGMYDESGNGTLKNNYISGSVAYHKALDENGYHHVGVGMSGTFAQWNLNAGKLIFEDQLTSLGFTGNTAELIDLGQRLNLSYFSFNTGLLYSGSTNEYNRFYVGASMYHINRPEKSFQGFGVQAKERYTLHAGGYFPVAAKTMLFLSGNFQSQHAAREIIGGAALGWMIDEDVTRPLDFYAGSWLRLGDAVIPFAGLDYGRLRIGVSYDINISGLTQASRRQGGFELSLMYIQPYKDRNRKYLACPSNF